MGVGVARGVGGRGLFDATYRWGVNLLLLPLLLLLLLHTTFVNGKGGHVSERAGGVTISSSSFVAVLATTRGRVVWLVRVRVLLLLLQQQLPAHDAATRVIQAEVGGRREGQGRGARLVRCQRSGKFLFF